MVSVFSLRTYHPLMFFSRIIALYCFFVAVGDLWGADITVQEYARGRYDHFGEDLGLRNNFATGFTSRIEFRAYFVFRLPDLPEPVTQAKIVAENVSSVFPPDVFTANVVLYDVVSPIDDVIDVGGVPVFEDLGDGTVYGNLEMHPDDIGEFVEFQLNSEAVNAINLTDDLSSNLINLIAFGAKLSPILAAEDEHHAVFGGTSDAAPVELILGFDPLLEAGDANQDYRFNQLDIVQVIAAGKYGTGEVATWGEGDWNGAPGGRNGEPPLGDGRFDQLDIVAALSNGVYLQGPYASEKRSMAVPELQSLSLLTLGVLFMLTTPKRMF